MTTHYEFTGASIADVLPDVDRVTARAVEEGRTYHVQYARHNAEHAPILAVVTVYAKREATDA